MAYRAADLSVPSVASSASSSSSTSSSPVASTSEVRLPHHKLLAWEAAKSLLLAVMTCSIRDAKLRDEALRAAKSACMNVAEGAGRVSRADKARAFAIARGEVVEAAAAVEIAALCGNVPAGAAREVARLADRCVALLTGLAR